MKVLNHIFDIILNLKEHYEFHKSRLYDIKHSPTPDTKARINLIRSKEVLKVAFIIYDITKWKSEELYLLMLEHPRFAPVLVPVMFFQGDYIESQRQFNNCIKLLESRKYEYVVGVHNIDIDELVNPDIVFYGELYENLFAKQYAFSYNSKRKSLACYVPYCFKNTNIPATLNHLENNLVWMGFVENFATLEDIKQVMSNNAVNHFATGLPIQDSFLNYHRSNETVWKTQDRRKKRIIWAPSHTIKSSGSQNAYEQSTFLELADEMLILAEKYKNEIQWAFKPHPVLRRKLVSLWGQSRTDAYYKKWSSLDYTQLEEGQYIDLFMSSDALVHDCMSFMVEYMFTEKPLLFLSNGIDNMGICNTQTNDAYKLHYKGNTCAEVESFIRDIVIGEGDILKKDRIAYKEKYLTPPNNTSASQNIINLILG